MLERGLIRGVLVLGGLLWLASAGAEPRSASEALRKALESGQLSQEIQQLYLDVGMGKKKLTYDEGALLGLADELIDSGRAREAMDVLNVAMAAFPTSAGPLAALGDAMRAQNSAFAARAYYQQALSKDPSSERAKAGLRALQGAGGAMPGAAAPGRAAAPDMSDAMARYQGMMTPEQAAQMQSAMQRYGQMQGGGQMPGGPGLAGMGGVPIHKPLIPVLESEGAEAAAAEYRRLKREEPDLYAFSERHLERVTRRVRGAEGLPLLELRAEEHPESAEAQVELAAAYFRAGRAKEGAEAMRRAEALEPGSEQKVLAAASGEGGKCSRLLVQFATGDVKQPDPEVIAGLQGAYASDEGLDRGLVWQVETTCDGAILHAWTYKGDVAPVILYPAGPHRFTDHWDGSWEFQVSGDGPPSAVRHGSPRGSEVLSRRGEVGSVR